MKKLMFMALISVLCIGIPCHSDTLHIKSMRLKAPQFFDDQALFDAARAGNVKGIQKALAAGANVNALDIKRGRTALMHAVARGCNQAVKVLIQAGADVNAVVWRGIKFSSTVRLTRMPEAYPLSVLGFAFREGASADVVNTLIESGAIVDYRGFFI